MAERINLVVETAKELRLSVETVKELFDKGWYYDGRHDAWLPNNRRKRGEL